MEKLPKHWRLKITPQNFKAVLEFRKQKLPDEENFWIKGFSATKVYPYITDEGYGRTDRQLFERWDGLITTEQFLNFMYPNQLPQEPIKTDLSKLLKLFQKHNIK